MMPSRSGFVTIGNSAFFEGVCALAASIRLNSPTPLCVIDEGFAPDQVRRLEAMDVRVIRVVRRIPINHPRFGCCYALFDIDQTPFDNIIYLDADTLVLEDIRDLFSRFDDRSILCALANPAARLVHRNSSTSVRTIFRQVGAPLRQLAGGNPLRAYRLWKYRRLNSGLVGVTRNVMARINQAIDRYTDLLGLLPFPDQDLLSLLTADLGLKVEPLEYVDNATRLHLHPELALEPRTWQRTNCERVVVEIRDGKATIVANRYPRGLPLDNARIRVLHYNSPDKPWRDDVTLRDGFRELWRYYADRSLSLRGAALPSACETRPC